ncbi:putative acetyltransferase [Microbacterium sp. SLBN-146]|nr:putative acetyltransferase [Microbacterium sp. SLBN-146]
MRVAISLIDLRASVICSTRPATIGSIANLGGVLIGIDDPKAPDVLALLEEHLRDMFASSPAESVHALDPEALTDPSITFWAARDAETGELLGVGALKQHDATMGELKSMRTSAAARGRGVASAVLAAILEECRARGVRELYLETGTQDYFAPARALYAKYGFRSRGPFADYTDDASSAYFELAL